MSQCVAFANTRIANCCQVLRATDKPEIEYERMLHLQFRLKRMKTGVKSLFVWLLTGHLLDVQVDPTLRNTAISICEIQARPGGLGEERESLGDGVFLLTLVDLHSN